MWNEAVYPITAKVEAELTLVAQEHQMSKLPEAVQHMINALGEYEHGTADIPDVFMGIDAVWAAAAEAEGELDEDDLEMQRNREQLMAYAAVTQDLALTIMMQS